MVLGFQHYDPLLTLPPWPCADLSMVFGLLGVHVLAELQGEMAGPGSTHCN